MMGEIVDDGNPVYLRLHFQPPLHALESFQRRRNLFLRDRRRRRPSPRQPWRSTRCIRRPKEIQNPPTDGPSRRTVQEVFSGSNFRLVIFHCARAPDAVALHWAECLAQAAFQAGTLGGGRRAIEGDNPAAPRNQIHQALKRSFDRVEIFVNVGVIELDRGQDDGVGKVVQELRPLIEEGGVVLVAFQDEVLPLPHDESWSQNFRRCLR